MPPGYKLIAYDVSALFTSIPLPHAIKAVRIKLDEDPKLQDCTPLSRERTLGRLSLCLNTTYFTYSGVIYKQKHVAAMGSPVSPIIANLYMEGFEGDCSPHSPQPHPSVWFRYVDDTFNVIHEYHVDEFTTNLNSLDYNIKFTTEPEQDGTLRFLDACVNINEDGSTHVIVYGKLTHTDQYLNFSLQHKRSVVRTLMRRAEVMVTRPDRRRKEMAHIQDSLKTNGYKQWMFKVPKPKQQQSITSTRPTINVGLACMQGTSEALTRVFKAHGVGTYNRHIN